MKVVLTKTIDNVGVIGDVKEVKPGYVRNFLLPRGLAVLSIDPRAKKLQAQRKVALEALAHQQKLVSELADQWRGQTYRLTMRASDEGTLYGSIGHKEISKLLGRDDLEFEAPAIKNTGTHKIDLKFTGGVTVPITLVVESEERAKTKN